MNIIYNIALVCSLEEKKHSLEHEASSHAAHEAACSVITTPGP